MPPDVGLLDTSVVIDLDLLSAQQLPAVLVISAITLAELSQGPSATDDLIESALRQEILQRTEATFGVLPFDVRAARSFGQVSAAVRAAGRHSRRRTVDLQIAAVALANGLPMYTRNSADFRGLDGLVTVVAV